MKNAITIFRIGKGIEMPHAPLRCDSWCDIMKDLALVRHVKMRSNGKTPVTVIATDCLRIRDTEKVANKNMHRLSAYMLSIEAYLSADIKPSNGILVQASICENVVGDMSSSSLSAESGYSVSETTTLLLSMMDAAWVKLMLVNPTHEMAL
ncbi:hypothetical protein CaCOL14_013154 [Colletotrichum acutatum]